MKNHKKRKNKKIKIYEKFFVSWLKYDPFVLLTVKNDDITRRNIMLNLLGKEAAQRYFGKLGRPKKHINPIFPQTVRDEVQNNLHDSAKRDKLIRTLILWASHPDINSIYVKSHLTRIQIIISLLGPIFFHANLNQEKEILKGLKYILVKKQTAIGVKGEQSYDVHLILLGRIEDILVHNQKVIINKAVAEAEEKMRVHLLKQIQELRGDRSTSAIYTLEMKTKVQKIVKEKFPLDKEICKHFEDILEFYVYCPWPKLREKAKHAKHRILEIRKPFTLTSKEVKS